MNSRGMSLIELLVGLAVAGMIAAIAMTALSMTGMALARQQASARSVDSAWLALAALGRDLHAADGWEGCLGAGNCARSRAHRAPNAVIAGQVRWFADNGLWRCAPNRDCGKYLEGVFFARFVADVRTADGRKVRRAEFAGDDAELLEVTLTMIGGDKYSRTVRRPWRAR